ncbi:DNA recombination protein RmuC [Roseomonas sp. OT10]|uniref:DNA recombination protein RmuC n=1 Tax=Roseomonas cutis TaxID=2897332 RepID=UPI001E51B399|nr:DNA recombination protein RmuC [Roseomonas sp. OT10]UFN47628.1 DNA recombination protein RmuC [Roseomonas sp. OT10]
MDLWLVLLVALAPGLLAIGVVLLRRPPAPGLTAEAMLPLVERLGALQSGMGEQLARQGREVEAAIAAQNQRLAEAQAAAAERARLQEGALAEQLARATRAMTDSLAEQARRVGEAAAAQNERLAQQEKALADRLAAGTTGLQAALAAQNERLNAALAGQTEKVNRQLGEQFAATQETAKAIGERLAVIDAARGNIEALGAQVTSLAGILSNKQTRGAFGEVQLRRLVEDRLPADGFSWQHTLSNRHRADCLIHLPHPPGPVVVDSKFPLESWRAGREAGDEAARVLHARAFASDVRKHVTDIAQKYLIPGETAEGALLFVPSEAIYAELHADHAALVEEAARRGVYVVSPSTLWAVLGTMRALMRDVRIRGEAARIQTAVRTLLDDVTRLDDRVDNLKRHFDQAEKDIRQIEISRDKIVRIGQRIGEVELEDEAGPALKLGQDDLASVPPAALPRA